MLKKFFPILLAAVMAAPALAENMDRQAMHEAMTKQITLTPEVVEQTLDAMEALTDRGLMQADEESAPSEAEAKAIMEEVADNHGFDNMFAMTAALNSTMRAYGAIRLEEEVGQADMDKAQAQYEKQRQRVKNDPNMAAERKQQMLKMLDAQHEAMVALADNENTDVVRPYRDRLEGIMDEAGIKR